MTAEIYKELSLHIIQVNGKALTGCKGVVLDTGGKIGRGLNGVFPVAGKESGYQCQDNKIDSFFISIKV
jgi:hypothetical protein